MATRRDIIKLVIGGSGLAFAGIYPYCEAAADASEFFNISNFSPGEVAVFSGAGINARLVQPESDGDYAVKLAERLTLFTIVDFEETSAELHGALVFNSVRISKYREPNGRVFLSNSLVPEDSTIAPIVGNVSYDDYRLWHSEDRSQVKIDSHRTLRDFHLDVNTSKGWKKTSEWPEAFTFLEPDEPAEKTVRSSHLQRFALVERARSVRYNTGNHPNKPMKSYMRISSINCKFGPIDIVFKNP